jgi:oxepin-CoA hydrolase/3-oxo-5,6-dehydrosuberyl-CoA semialdehyde dehydrogenase
MNKFKNYVLGQWTPGSDAEYVARHAVTGEALGSVSSLGLDYAEVLDYGRREGGSALRAMTFPQRGLMLKALAMHLQARKEDYYAVSYATGATRVDSWIDIEGGIGNLYTYASLRREFADLPYHVEGSLVKLSKGGTFGGQHIMLPKRGVAVHINAFNFPVWGMLEKIAVNLLAGVPAVVKPSEFTSFLTERVARDIISSGILPEGALQLLVGKGHGLLDAVERQDVVTFTGSYATGYRLKSTGRFSDLGVPFNLEADSLNATVLGPEAVVGTPEFDLFVKEVAKEMTIKAGQKCTAVRRIIVPEGQLEAVQTAVAQRLAGLRMGDPAQEGVRMGPLATTLQAERVREAAQLLAGENEVVYGSVDGGSDGAYYQPLLMRCARPLEANAAHRIEAFGPVATLMPYRDIAQAAQIAALGGGSLVSSIVTADKNAAKEFVLEAGYSHGRVLVLDAASAKESTGHGSPMPLLTHGGPGRAGDGEEMGGIRGVLHYLQRVAVQGHPNVLSHVAERYYPGADRPEANPHLFRQHFEDLRIGDTVTTATHTVTLQDIEDFAELSGDKFYAHMDANSLEGTIFTGRVAHGYFILSRAAGLFVDPPKGPVLLNYGIDTCRFTKPVYPGSTIQVKLTVQEKVDQERRSPEDIAKGIVKYYVEVVDETADVVAVATILTMVKKLNQA